VTRTAREEGRRSHASRRATENADEKEREKGGGGGETKGIGDGDDKRGGGGARGNESARERPNGSETRGKIAIAIRTNELIRVS